MINIIVNFWPITFGIELCLKKIKDEKNGRNLQIAEVFVSLILFALQLDFVKDMSHNIVGFRDIHNQLIR